MCIEYISSDDERREIIRQQYPTAYHYNDIPNVTDDQIWQWDKRLWKKIFGKIHQSLRNNRHLILDSANCKQKYIDRYVGIARRYKQVIYVVVMETPYEVCLVRNGLREITVPLSTVQEMWYDFRQTHLTQRKPDGTYEIYISGKDILTIIA